MRIDRQLFGRAGRQGDPGSAQMFVSLEDEIVKLYAPKLAGLVANMSSGDEITGGARTRAVGLFELAQRRAQKRSRISRAEVLKQDDWIEQNLPGQ